MENGDTWSFKYFVQFVIYDDGSFGYFTGFTFPELVRKIRNTDKKNFKLIDPKTYEYLRDLDIDLRKLWFKIGE